ncbi:XRE family transcriptional regulator [Acinetobacter baumannii]|uniref:helix-turn-helix domain-containing protein n=1 Tax=Acinetobacter baumannii TaxID=470 RepID=UPI002449ED8E|nr:XRE family transcriptional regulator [Acinetobacter baumannii]MDH2539932.1 XRE family transcriptional regulator [Acinetobacter baumannii]
MSQPSTVLQHVGTNIRSLRDERDLSQQDLADQAGVSRRTIAALETGQVNISLAKLDSIAAVLDVDFKTIVSAPEHKEHPVVNALAWQGKDEESKATLLASVPSRSQVELWTWSLAVGESYVAEADAEGWQELIYVLEGELTILFTDSSKTIAAGSSFIFASSVTYTYINSGSQVLKFIRNVVY